MKKPEAVKMMNHDYNPFEGDTWRVFRIIAEFVEGFEDLSQIGNAVTIFGSARTTEDDKYYHLAVKTAKIFGESGYSVITGGGGGIMEAANKGAQLAETTSVGLNIDLPFEQSANAYISKLINFRYFFVRKVMFLKYARAIVVFPGGFGTLDEFFESITLIQTKKITPVPVVLVGSDYWGKLLDWIEEVLEERKLISSTDKNIYTLMDEPEKIVKYVMDFYKKD